MLNIIMCDDNLNMLTRIYDLFNDCIIKHDYDAQIVLKTTDYREILNYVESNKTDIVVLDIQLNNKSVNGLNVAEKIREINKECYIIFTTGHMEYVLHAYKLKTFDYLYKPISSEAVEDTLERLFDDIQGLPRKFIKIDNKNIVVDVDEIQYIRREGMKLIYHTKTSEFETYSSFNKIEHTLPGNFVRCHKSFIANVDNITNVQTNMVSFKDNSSCDIGPKYKNNLMEVFNYGNFE